MPVNESEDDTMTFRSWTLGMSTVALGALAFAHACGGDDTSPPPPASGGSAGAGTAGSAGAAGSADGGAGAPSDGGDASPELATPIFLARFPTSQLPEGIWVRGGTPLVGLTQLAAVVTVTADGGTAPFGSIGEAGAASASNALGITTDTAGNVYVAVGTLTPDAGAIPSPGVYKFPPAGGAGTLFSSAPGMNFPNGLDFVGTTLYVADSEGVVYAI